VSGRQWLAVVALAVGVIGMQQGLQWVSGMPWLAEQASLIRQRDLEPAVFFYTDSPQALAAEKQVRERVEHAE
jgi:hypothetical protein